MAPAVIPNVRYFPRDEREREAAARAAPDPAEPSPHARALSMALLDASDAGGEL